MISANVAHPTDSLLAKAVGKLVRAARRVQAAGGAPATAMTGRRRAAARRVPEIASKLRSRGKLGREEITQAIARVTGELADLAEKAMEQAAAVVRNGRRAVPEALSGRMRGTRTWLAGQTPESATRLVSLHDPDARPIRKGRIDRPVEFRWEVRTSWLRCV